MKQFFFSKALIIGVVITAMLMGKAQSSMSLDETDLPPLIKRDLFFGDPEIAGAQISPNGEYISFLKPYKGVRNIFVKKRGEPFENAKPVTADDRPVSSYFWSQDSKYLLYVQDKGGNENFHIYAVDPSADPKEETGVPPAKDLTPMEGIRANIYSVPENTPDKILVGLNKRDASYHDVFEITISSGERELIFKNTQNISGYTFDLKGNLRLASRQTEDGGTEILRYEKDTFKRIYKCGFEETASPLRFHKNNEKVYFITNKGEDVDLTRLTLLNPQTGETELIEKDPENEVDFGNAIFDDKTEELLATIYTGARQRIYPKNKKMEKMLSFLREELPDGELSLRSTGEDMRYILVGVSQDVNPGSVYLFDRKDKTVELLYNSRPKLNNEHLAPMKAVSYEARDGLEIPAYLTLPKGVEHKDLPTIMLIHGGPWSRVTWGYNPYAQFLANRGYAVLQPNFRGSTGYGKEFLNAGNKEWGTGKMQHDISDGVKFLIEEGYADPDKIGIFGGSYGGYATLAGLTFTPELYAAGVSYVGPSNLMTLLNSLPPYWAPIKKMFHKRVGNPNKKEEKKQLKKQSPLFSAEKIDDPLLVIQGANDPRVKKQESDQIVVAARENNVDVKYLVAQNEGHGFRQQNNRLVVAAAMEKFFAKHLDGRYQKSVSDEIQKRWDELKRDINKVTMPDTSSQAKKQKSSFPELNPGKIEPFTAKYDQTVKAGGREIDVSITRKLQSAQINNTDAWLITSKSKSPQGSSVDSFYLDKKTAMPVKRIVNQPRVNFTVNYMPDKITGVMKMRGKERDLEIQTDKKLLGMPEIVTETMNLDNNFTAEFNMLNLMQQKVQNFSMKVLSTETIEVPKGEYKCYKVSIKSEEGGTPKQTLYFSVKSHKLIKSVNELPASMGNATVISELKE